MNQQCFKDENFNGLYKNVLQIHIFHKNHSIAVVYGLYSPSKHQCTLAFAPGTFLGHWILEGSEGF